MEKQLVHPTAERCAAAAVLHGDDTATQVLEIVSGDDFSSPQLALIVTAVQRLFHGVEPIDTQSIIVESRHIVKEKKMQVMLTESYLHELMKTDTRRAVPYATTVRRYSWLRQARDFSAWYTAEVDALPDPEDLYKRAQEKMTWLKPPTADGRFVYGWDTANYPELIEQRRVEAETGKQVVYDWPWATWNKYVRSLRAGMVGLLAGPEGSGKSGYLEMIAEHWATKGHVVFVHLENNIEYTKDRRIARHARIDIDTLEGGLLTQDELNRVRNADLSMSAFLPQLHYFDAAGMTMAEIVNELRSRHAEGICDAVVLDYLNKVRVSRGQAKLYSNDLTARQSDDMEQFKSFCENACIPGVTAAQYNKEGKQSNGRKRSWNIRGSGELADKSQLVVLLDREVLESPLTDPTGRIIAEAGEDSPVVEVRIDKQNRGKKMDFEQVYRGEYFEVRDKPCNANM